MVQKMIENEFNNRRLKQCCISHRLTKTGQQKMGRKLPGSGESQFHCDIWIPGSEFRVNNIKLWI